MLKLDGERVVDAVPDIGYLHSGFEKLGEHLDYNQYVTITDRMNYISPLANNVAWHGAVEKLLGIEITPRCKYIRTIVAELSRISDHLLCNGAAGLDVGAFTYFLYAFNQREKILRHFRDALRRALHQQLHPRRRRDVRHHAAGDREDPRLRQELPQDARRHGAAAEPQPHFRRPHQGRRRPVQGGGHQPQLHRPDRPGQRRGATCARTSRTWPTPISISRSAAPRPAIATPATWCAWPRCARA